MNGVNDLAKMVPGFEFLQNMMKGAGASLPGVQGFGQWVAPTLDPEELDKRIQELKTVQFWLEQNARLLGATIQALEVQRMTLSTLQTMNLPLAELRHALQARASAPPPAPAPRAAPAAEAEDEPEAPAAAPPPKTAPASPAAAAPAAIDPMQWWGALTQQFTEIATKAVKDSTANAAREVAGAAVKQGLQAGLGSAGQTLKKAAGLPARTAKAAVKAATKVAAPRQRKG